MNEKKIRILMVGSDLTSNGGIASVVKALYSSSNNADSTFEFKLLKTCYYNDKGLWSEVLILFKALIIFIPLLVKYRIRIVHLHTSSHFSYYRTLIFFILSKFFGKKTIIHLHASDFYDYFIESNRLNSLNKLVFKSSDRLIVLCNDWKIKLEKKYNLTNVIYLPNPITEQTRSGAPEYDHQKKSAFQILFIGFLIKSKGIYDIIDIAYKLKSNNINAKIVIAGKGFLQDFLIDQIKQRNLNDYLEFYGWADESSKNKLYLNSDIFLLPSYKEGMPITILEAMTYGLPVISTIIAGIPDEVSHLENGLLFQPGDIDSFYNAINTLIINEELRKEMGLNSLKRSKSFYSSEIFNKLTQIYQEII